MRKDPFRVLGREGGADTAGGTQGPDRGEGAKYLLLPPLADDFEGKNETFDGDVTVGAVESALLTDFQVVEGLQEVMIGEEKYYATRSRCNTNLIALRGFTDENGSPDSTAEIFRMGFRAYPLGDPPAAEAASARFVDISKTPINTIHSSDVGLFEEVHELVQQEALSCFGPELLGLAASVGIEQGKPFAPSPRMQKILEKAAALGNAAGRSLAFAPRNPESYPYGPDSAWITLFPGGSYRWLTVEGARTLDARAAFFFVATFVTPFMSLQNLGLGSQYLIAARDAEGAWLSGSNTYQLTLPPGIPAKDFWSVVAYDAQTRSMVVTPQEFPAVSSKRGAIESNPEQAGEPDLAGGGGGAPRKTGEKPAKSVWNLFAPQP